MVWVPILRENLAHRLSTELSIPVYAYEGKPVTATSAVLQFDSIEQIEPRSDCYTVTVTVTIRVLPTSDPQQAGQKLSSLWSKFLRPAGDPVEILAGFPGGFGTGHYGTAHILTRSIVTAIEEDEVDDSRWITGTGTIVLAVALTTVPSP